VRCGYSSIYDFGKRKIPAYDIYCRIRHIDSTADTCWYIDTLLIGPAWMDRTISEFVSLLS
jgi:hypothetical protein